MQSIIFLEADSVNPKLAVVKQQLANYLIEERAPRGCVSLFDHDDRVSSFST